MADKSSKRRGALIGAGLLLAPLAAAGGWIAYSRLAVNHNMPLPKALDARRGTVGTTVGRLSYYADDSAGGTPLLLVHSINAAASAYEMRPLFEHYRGQRPVYALELPGFGFSERPNIIYTPEVFRDAILEFLAKVVEQPADVIALSLSSEFAALAAQQQPERFNSIAMISPTGFASSQQRSRSDRAGQSGTGARLYNVFTFPFGGRAFYDLLATLPSIRSFLSRSFVGAPDEGLVRYAYRTAHQQGAHYAPLYFVSGQLFTPNVREEVYAQLPMPVLVIYDEDAYTGFSALEPFAREHPNWRTTRVQPTRGLPHFEQLGKTTDALNAFWLGT